MFLKADFPNLRLTLKRILSNQRGKVRNHADRSEIVAIPFVYKQLVWEVTRILMFAQAENFKRSNCFLEEKK